MLEKKLKQLCERCGGGNSRWVYQSWVKSDMDTLLSKDLSTIPLQPAIDWLHGSLSTFLKFNSKRPGCDLHCVPSRSVVLHLVG